jgi:hypothetical protein
LIDENGNFIGFIVPGDGLFFKTICLKSQKKMKDTRHLVTLIDKKNLINLKTSSLLKINNQTKNWF